MDIDSMLRPFVRPKFGVSRINELKRSEVDGRPVRTFSEMLGLFKKTATPIPTAPAKPNRTPVEEIAYRHGEVYGAQAPLLQIDAPLTVVDGGMHHGQSAKKYLQAFPACRILGFEPEA